MATNTSTAQALANRANAALSTGPRTEEGKQRSAQNALTHGATSRRLLVGQETQSQFDSFRDSVFQHHQPSGDYEILLTEKVAITAWRHHRMLRIESEFYSRVTHCTILQEMDTDAQAIAPFYLDPEMERVMRTFPRYVGGAAREWKHAMSALETIQKERRAKESSEAPPPPPTVPAIEETTDAVAAQPEPVLVIAAAPATTAPATTAPATTAPATTAPATTAPATTAPATTAPAATMPAAVPVSLTRSERRAIERAQRKAARRAARPEIGFVSQAAA